jgi:hypothetical protein
MSALMNRALDWFRGGGAYAVTTPPMDGALQPNQAIEEADVVRSVTAPDNLTLDQRQVIYSCGNQLRVLDRGEPTDADRILAGFDAPVSALSSSQGGALAIALNDGHIFVQGGRHDGLRIRELIGHKFRCLTALAFDGEDALLICDASEKHGPDAWKADLMSLGATGSVWRMDLASSRGECLARGLAYPYGILPTALGSVIVSESWRHRLLELKIGAGPSPILTDLPGYPSRIARKKGGGYWLTVFAPRSQLIEFVLKERAYCERMMECVPPELWIAPALRSPRSFLEPLQGGALKQLGRVKPWAPSRSYGLLIGLDENFEPRRSWHSRADGTRHGITACLELDNAVLLASQGGDAILSLSLFSAGSGDDSR